MICALIFTSRPAMNCSSLSAAGIDSNHLPGISIDEVWQVVVFWGISGTQIQSPLIIKMVRWIKISCRLSEGVPHFQLESRDLSCLWRRGKLWSRTESLKCVTVQILILCTNWRPCCMNKVTFVQSNYKLDLLDMDSLQFFMNILLVCASFNHSWLHHLILNCYYLMTATSRRFYTLWF